MSRFCDFLYMLTRTFVLALHDDHDGDGNNADTAICQSIFSPAYHFALQPSPFAVAAKNSRSNHC